MAGSIGGSVSLTPSQVKATLSSNYLTASDFDFMNQYLPDLYEREFARYGDRSIASFLRQQGAEIPSNSDLIKWTEEGRLHTKYTAVVPDSAATTDTALFSIPGSDVCVFRKGQTVFLSSETVAANSAKGIITGVGTADGLADDQQFRVAIYTAGGSPFTQTTETVVAYVYGSEFRKGTAGMEGSLEAEVDIFEVSPIIIMNNYQINGSDMAQIGWVEVETDNGMGFLWYLKSKSETRKRFEDYLEMSMVEAVPAESASGAIAANYKGTDGLFYAIENRGNTWSGGVPDTLAEFDIILNRLDKQGAIAENTLFINRTFTLSIDDMLAAQNSYGVGGTSFGLFDNDEQMALNLGFTGFRRGSYDFYKTDWKYLNEATLRGGLTGGAINGVLAPAGTTNVYDQVAGARMARPFLHVRYRKSETEDRKYKSWVTGSAGGANTTDEDFLRVNFLTERALCTMGANNFFIFKG
jgi:hypothetical protein